MLICLCNLAIFNDFKIHICLCLCPWIQVPVKTKEAPIREWARVTGNCELPDLGARSELRFSERAVWVLKHQAILRVKPSLQLHLCFVLKLLIQSLPLKSGKACSLNVLSPFKI